MGALVLLGVLAGHSTARAQFSFGQTRFGFNPNNPFVAQQQFMANLQANRYAIAAGAQVPAWLPYLAPYAAPAVFPPYMGGGGYIPPYVPPAYWGGGGYGGLNPYSSGYGGITSNVYSAGGGGGNGTNPYLSSYAYGGGYGANPAVGPGVTLMGTADVMRAYGTVITSQEQARMMREQYYQAKLETRKKKFDLDMYIKANTPTPTEEAARVAKQQLIRIQQSSNPAEIADGRALNFLLDDIARHPGKTPVSEIPLDASSLQHLNIRTAGTATYSFGMLRDGGKLRWPIALIELITPETRKEMDARSQALAQNAIAGKEPDPNAIRDLRAQVDRADEQLRKRANHFDTPDYTAATRFIEDLRASLRAISSRGASTQVQFQQLAQKGDIQNLSDLVRTMVARGWRFGPALPEDEATYRALYSGLVSYDVALNQMVSQSEP
jgi:hypothetical protein